jgi:hypothetical protein
LERFWKLVLISFFLMILAGAAPFTMDELMLLAILSLPTILIAVLPEIFIYISILLPPALYLILLYTGSLPDFNATYLGGYPAAIFYLPVMLFGFLAGRAVSDKRSPLPLTASMLLLSAILLTLVPPYKMEVSPSFMALASLLSIILYICVERIIRIPSFQAVSVLFFEYLGRNPIRYWVLMFLLFVIPVRFYLFAEGQHTAGLDPAQAVFVSLAFSISLFLISKLIDWIIGFAERVFKKTKT